MSEKLQQRSFEENMNLLNEIVKQMENEQLNLDVLTKRYVEALQIIDTLHEQINHAKAEIESVQQKQRSN